MSQFQKLVKESSSQFDFEQRVSISRDYQGSRRKKRSKKVSKKSKRPGRQDDEESVMSGMSGARPEPMSATVGLGCNISTTCKLMERVHYLYMYK